MLTVMKVQKWQVLFIFFLACVAVLLSAPVAAEFLPARVDIRLLDTMPKPVIQEIQVLSPVHLIQQHHMLAAYQHCLTQKPCILPAGEYTIISRTTPIAIEWKIPGRKSFKRQYTGQLTVRIQRDAKTGLLKADMINRVPIRDYLASVVSGETLPGWPSEAIKAQAVLAQTYLIAQLRHHRSGAFILSDSTQDQRYAGVGVIRPAVQQAVRAVQGQGLFYQGQPVQVLYHSTCGGQTSSSDYFSGGNIQSLPYLIPVPCPYCQHSDFAKPHAVVIPNAVYRSAMQTSARETQRDMQDTIVPDVRKTEPAGRPLLMSNGETGYQYWLKLGQHLGWDKVPGTRYTLKKLKNGDVEISSIGAGHGVGLCQWGAAGMAAQGKTYQQILYYYFPGTRIEKFR